MAFDPRPGKAVVIAEFDKLGGLEFNDFNVYLTSPKDLKMLTKCQGKNLYTEDVSRKVVIEMLRI